MSAPLHGPRLVIDSNDKAGIIVIITAVGISWTSLTLIVRLVSKLQQKSIIGLEELLVIIASCLAFISSACILGAVGHGLGKRTTEVESDEHESALKLVWASDIFYLCTLAVAKGAALPLLSQLTPMKKVVFACYGLAGLIGCWGFASIIMVATRCHVSAPWNDESTAQCSSLFTRWTAIESISIFIEVAIFTLFASVIYILQMPIKAKLKVAFAFSARLSVIIPTVFRLVHLKRGLESTQDALFAMSGAIAATQAVLHYTTMAASFAYLKPFLRAFDSNLGATVKVDNTVYGSYVRGSRSGGRSGKLDSNSKTMELSTLTSRSSVRRVYKGPGLSSEAQVQAGNDYNGREGRDKVSHETHGSSDSVAPIITKTEGWTVHTEPMR